MTSKKLHRDTLLSVRCGCNYPGTPARGMGARLPGHRFDSERARDLRKLLALVVASSGELHRRNRLLDDARLLLRELDRARRPLAKDHNERKRAVVADEPLDDGRVAPRHGVLLLLAPAQV
jgi:hypothetical protein